MFATDATRAVLGDAKETCVRLLARGVDGGMDERMLHGLDRLERAMVQAEVVLTQAGGATVSDVAEAMGWVRLALGEYGWAMELSGVAREHIERAREHIACLVLDLLRGNVTGKRKRPAVESGARPRQDSVSCTAPDEIPPPKAESPPVDSTSNTPCVRRKMEISKVPPPRSYTATVSPPTLAALSTATALLNDVFRFPIP